MARIDNADAYQSSRCSSFGSEVLAHGWLNRSGEGCRVASRIYFCPNGSKSNRKLESVVWRQIGNKFRQGEYARYLLWFSSLGCAQVTKQAAVEKMAR